MGNVDSIPVVSQTISIAQTVTGDTDLAKQVANDFSINIASQVNVGIGSTFRLFPDDEKETWPLKDTDDHKEKIWSSKSTENHQPKNQPKSVQAKIKWMKAELFASDKGSGAEHGAYFYHVANDKLQEHEYPIGIVCRPHKSETFIPVIIGIYGKHVIRPTKGQCTKIWDDRGSGNKNNYQLWRPVAPDGFVALSDIPACQTKVSNDHNKIDFKGIYCVSKELIRKGSIDKCVWSSKGMKADKSASIWRVNKTKFMISTTGDSQPKERIDTLDFYKIKKQSKRQNPKCDFGHELMKYKQQGVCCGCNNSFYLPNVVTWYCSKCDYKLCSECGFKKLCDEALERRVLRKGDCLDMGQRLLFTFASHRTKLIMQDDGNLCLYFKYIKTNRQVPIWDTWHVGKVGSIQDDKCKLIMCNDNNLRLYDRNSKCIWDTMHTERAGNYKKEGLKLMLTHGNLCLCTERDEQVVWSAIRRVKNPHIIIIGIKKYVHPNKNLNGVPSDVEKMKNIWSGTYGFNGNYISIIDYKKHLKRKDIDTFLKNELQKIDDSKLVDGLIFCYTGHGCQYQDEDCIVASDGECMSIKGLMNNFSDETCLKLSNKPKLFYFDCCRGNKGKPADQLGLAKGNQNNINQQTAIIKSLHISDYLSHYSSAPGYKSYQSKDGSFFIQAMSEAYKKYHHKDVFNITKDINDIVKKIRNGNEIGDPDDHLGSDLYLVGNDTVFSPANIDGKSDDDFDNEHKFSSKELVGCELFSDKIVVSGIAGDGKNRGEFEIKSFRVACVSDTPSEKKMVGVVLYYWFDHMETGQSYTSGEEYEYFRLGGRKCRPGYILLVETDKMIEKCDGRKGTYHATAFYYLVNEKWNSYSNKTEMERCSDAKFSTMICGGFSRMNGKYVFNSATFNQKSDGYHKDKDEDKGYDENSRNVWKEMSDLEIECVKQTLNNWTETGENTMKIGDMEFSQKVKDAYW